MQGTRGIIESQDINEDYMVYTEVKNCIIIDVIITDDVIYR